jgi:hypothetical protein
MIAPTVNKLTIARCAAEGRQAARENAPASFGKYTNYWYKQIHLRPSVQYDTHRAEFQKTLTCPTNAY